MGRTRGEEGEDERLRDEIKEDERVGRRGRRGKKEKRERGGRRKREGGRGKKEGGERGRRRRAWMAWPKTICCLDQEYTCIVCYHFCHCTQGLHKFMVTCIDHVSIQGH